jgi:hypothetical protein
VVIGYQELSEVSSEEQPLELFVLNLEYPVIIVGQNGPDTFLLNHKAFEIRDQLALPPAGWQVLEDTNVSWQILQSA